MLRVNINQGRLLSALFAGARRPMSADSSLEHNYGQLSRPLHVQQLESALRLGPFLSYVEKVVTDPLLSRQAWASSQLYYVLSKQELVILFSCVLSRQGPLLDCSVGRAFIQLCAQWVGACTQQCAQQVGALSAQFRNYVLSRQGPSLNNVLSRQGPFCNYVLSRQRPSLNVVFNSAGRGPFAAMCSADRAFTQHFCSSGRGPFSTKYTLACMQVRALNTVTVSITVQTLYNMVTEKNVSSDQQLGLAAC